MKRSLTTITLFIITMISVQAQQVFSDVTNFNQYFLINPAMTAPWDYTEVGAGHSQNWLDIDGGAPSSTYAYLTKPLRKGVVEDISFGAIAFNQRDGLLNRLKVQIPFAYHIPMGKGGDGQLVIGISPYLSQLSLDGTKAVFIDEGDPFYFSQKLSSFSFNVDAGIFYSSVRDSYYDENFWFLGASFQKIRKEHLVESDKEYVLSERVTLESVHYNLLGGWRYVDGDKYLELSGIVNWFPKTNMRAGLNFIYERQVIWGGLSLFSNVMSNTQPIVSQPSMTAQFGIKRKQLRVGFKYQYSAHLTGIDLGSSFGIDMAYLLLKKEEEE